MERLYGGWNGKVKLRKVSEDMKEKHRWRKWNQPTNKRQLRTNAQPAENLTLPFRILLETNSKLNRNLLSGNHWKTWTWLHKMKRQWKSEMATITTTNKLMWLTKESSRPWWEQLSLTWDFGRRLVTENHWKGDLNTQNEKTTWGVKWNDELKKCWQRTQ